MVTDLGSIIFIVNIIAISYLAYLSFTRGKSAHWSHSCLKNQQEGTETTTNNNIIVWNKNVSKNELLTFLQQEFSPSRNTDVVH